MLRFLVRLINVLVVLLLVRVVLRTLAAWFRGGRRVSGATPTAKPPLREAGELVRDRVCNTFVPRERAVRALVAGEEAHFCSTACRDRALAQLTRAS